MRWYLNLLRKQRSFVFWNTNDLQLLEIRHKIVVVKPETGITMHEIGHGFEM